MPSNASSVSGPRWFAVQTLSNMEGKAKKHLDKFLRVEEMEDRIFEVLLPTKMVAEVRSGKKRTKLRKFYPGYLFIQMRLYDDDGKLLQEPWHFVKNTQGIINFVGGARPIPLKEVEINRILKQVQEAEGKEAPSVNFQVGQEVKINEGPFHDVTGSIEAVYNERGRVKVSVPMFGRFTPVEFEFSQIKPAEEA